MTYSNGISRTCLLGVALAAVVLMTNNSGADEEKMKPEATTPESKEGEKDVLSFKMKDIDGREIDLSEYRGKVLLIVNTASRCGLTPQYEGLVNLQKQYGEREFFVLAFPANDFGKQEPGSDS
jgi:glutathione peroxidase